MTPSPFIFDDRVIAVPRYGGEDTRVLGGKGSGNFGHRGRPGAVGGSGEGGDQPMPGFTATPSGQPLTPELQKEWQKITREMHERLTEHRNIEEYDQAIKELETTGKADVYHGTMEEALASIAENGLIPKGGPGADAWAQIHWPDTFKTVQKADAVVKGRATSVYVTANKTAAERFARIVQDKHADLDPFFDDSDLQGDGPKGVVLKVSIPKEAASRLRIDELSHSMRFEGKIPPEWISRVVNGMDAPISQYKRPKAAAAGDDTLDLYFVFFTADTQPRTAGGEGSGNFGHAGRPGEVGGSGEGGTTSEDIAKTLGVDFSDPFQAGKVHVDDDPVTDRASQSVASTLKELKDKGYKMPDQVEVKLTTDPIVSGETETDYHGFAGQTTTLRVMLPEALPKDADLDHAVQVAFGASKDQYPLTSVTNMKEVVLHEMGHVLSNPVPDISATGFKSFGSTQSEQDRRMRSALRSVSHYAETRKEEFVAEAFVRKYRGETLTPDAEKLYRLLRGPEIK